MKILVIGCGSIGRRHAANAAALVEAAVMDCDRDRAEQAAAAWGGQVFTRLEEALAWGPTACVIATPHDSHVEIGLAAVAAGAHLLVEKPLALDPVAATSLVEAAQAAERQLRVVCNMRFHPGPAKLAQALERVGPVRFARAHYGSYLPAMRPGQDYRQIYAAHAAQGGGVILDSVHEIDYLGWLLGPVRAAGGAAARLSELEIDVEDYAEIHLCHQQGARSQIHLDYLQHYKRRGCEIVGDKGTLIWRSEGKKPEHLQILFLGETGAREVIHTEEAVDPMAPYQAMMQSFVTGLENGDLSALQSGPQAIDALTIALRLRLGGDGKTRQQWAALGGLAATEQGGGHDPGR